MFKKKSIVNANSKTMKFFFVCGLHKKPLHLVLLATKKNEISQVELTQFFLLTFQAGPPDTVPGVQTGARPVRQGDAAEGRFLSQHRCQGVQFVQRRQRHRQGTGYDKRSGGNGECIRPFIIFIRR